MDNKVIAYRTRDKFQADFGRAVTPDPEIRKLAPSDLSILPPRSFRDYVHSVLEDFCENDTLLDAMMFQAKNRVLFPETPPYDNDNVNQSLCTKMHDALLHQMDRKVMDLAYLIKIADHLPMLSKHYRGAFCHLVERDHVQRGIYTLYFDQLADKDFLLNLINDTIDTVFPILHGLRHYFSSETKKQRKSKLCKDDFAQKFLRCEEVQTRDMPDRIEYQFFRDYGIQLGITPIRNPKVYRYIGKQCANPDVQETLFNKISYGHLSMMFPGYVVSQQCRDELYIPCLKRHITSAAIRRKLSTATPCFIPKNGVILG